MKISPRKAAWKGADASRASSAAAGIFLRSLASSSFVHLALLWSLTWIGFRVPAAGGRPPHTARVLFAGLTPAEVLPRDEEPVEPEREVTTPPVDEAEPMPDVPVAELPPLPEFTPVYEHRDPFEDLSTSLTLVKPTSVDAQPIELADPFASTQPRLEEPDPVETEAEQADEEVASAEEEAQPGATEGDAEPALRYGLPPAYPRTARRMGWEGEVVCRITISVDGKVKDVEVETGSGYAVLDQAALEAIRAWLFDPGTRGGEPAEREILHMVRFRLT